MSDAAKPRRRKGGSRAAMIAKRSKPPAVNPAPAGPSGGQYRPLTAAQVEQIYDTSMRMLAELGMGDSPRALTDQALKCGATLNDLGRLCFSRDMVEDIIDDACKSFVFHGRDEKYSFEVGGDRVYFGTGGAAVQTLDLDSHVYRPSTLEDLCGFTRLADTLPNISWFTRCCVATDVPDIFELDINTAYCLMRGTQKPVGTNFTIGEHVDPIVDMFDWVAGGTGKFAEKPFCKAHISPIISPMRYGEDAFEVAMACIRRGMPINAIVAAMSGATSPATIDGMLAASFAETLAALVMINTRTPRRAPRRMAKTVSWRGPNKVVAKKLELFPHKVVGHEIGQLAQVLGKEEAAEEAQHDAGAAGAVDLAAAHRGEERVARVLLGPQHGQPAGVVPERVGHARGLESMGLDAGCVSHMTELGHGLYINGQMVTPFDIRSSIPSSSPSE